MVWAWYLAAIGLGLALGLYFGRLLSGMISNWESITVVSAATKSAVIFLLGGGAGAGIFQLFSGADCAVFYVIGLSIGMIHSYFLPQVLPRYTLDGLTVI